MNEERVQELLQAYTYGTLTPVEMKELAAAALDDDELFLRMSEAEDQRRVLAVPGVRTEALRIVREAQPIPKPSWRSNFQWLLRPMFAAPAVCLALLLAVVITRTQVDLGDRQMPTGVDGQLFQDEAKTIIDLQPAGSGPPVALATEPWMNGTVTEASRLSFRVKLDEPASLVVVQEMPDKRARFVFPESLIETVDVPAGEHTIALEASPPGSNIAGTVRLVVVAFPPGTDVRLEGSNLESARQHMTRRDISYVVKTP